MPSQSGRPFRELWWQTTPQTGCSAATLQMGQRDQPEIEVRPVLLSACMSGSRCCRPIPMRDLSFDEVRIRHLEAIATSSGLGVDDLLRAHTMVLAEDDRAGSDMAVAYHIGSATVIKADPVLVAMVEPLAASDRALDPDALARQCSDRGLSVVAGGDQRIVSAKWVNDRPVPSDANQRVLDPSRRVDRRLITDLFDCCDPDDVDAAEFEADRFDPRNLGLIDATTGRLAAFASSRPFADGSPFDDIGVLTADEYRGRGWGGAAVRGLCDVIFDDDRLPLYRNDWDRPASSALAQPLGFELVARLSAIVVAGAD